MYPSYPSRSSGLIKEDVRLVLQIFPTLVVLDEVTPLYPSYPCCPNEVAPVNILFPRRSWWTLRLSIFSKLVVLKDVTPVNLFL